MTQEEKRIYLINYLLGEHDGYRNVQIPTSEAEQKNLLRSLMNVRSPRPVSHDFLDVQDSYLQEEIGAKGITRLSDLMPVREGIYLWQGDITTLEVDAIVNAANSGMLGCFVPCHGCIDNAIHTFAGVQLRLACAGIMERQGHEEATGGAKITPAFNLPCQSVIHTVGPIVRGSLNARDCELLASCYRSCMELADRNGLKSIAFCCISTGEFHFPNDRAAGIAVETVLDYRKQTQSDMEVIFNVFKGTDLEIYEKLLGAC